MFSTAPAKRRETLHQMARLVAQGGEAEWKEYTGQLLVVVLEGLAQVRVPALTILGSFDGF
jgi:hypothetical protein